MGRRFYSKFEKVFEKCCFETAKLNIAQLLLLPSYLGKTKASKGETGTLEIENTGTTLILSSGL